MALAAGMFIAPAADEVIGGWQFQALCGKVLNDSIESYAEIGPGAFFDAGGQEIWRKRQPTYFNFLLSEEPFKSEFDSYIEYRSSGRTISGHAIPIHERTFEYVNRSNGRVLHRQNQLTSSGGWLRRTFLGGFGGGYYCGSPRSVALQGNELMRFSVTASRPN